MKNLSLPDLHTPVKRKGSKEDIILGTNKESMTSRKIFNNNLFDAVS